MTGSMILFRCSVMLLCLVPALLMCAPAAAVSVSGGGMRADILRNAPMARLVSTEPAPLSLSANAGEGIGVLAGPVGGPLRMASSMTRSDWGRAWALTWPDLGVSAHVVFSENRDCLRIQATYTFTKKQTAPLEIALGGVWNPSEWSAYYIPDFFRCLIKCSPRQRSFYRFYGNPHDISAPVPAEEIKGGTHVATLPLCVLERKDRYVVWGNLNINTFAILRPNYQGMNPCMMADLKDMPAGSHITFQVFTRSFPKPENSLVDVARWCFQNLYSTNPVTKGIVALPKRRAPRTIPEGGITGSHPPVAFAEDWYIHTTHLTPENIAAQEQLTLKMHWNNLWWGAQDWEELYPVTGKWITAAGLTVSASELRKEIARLDAMDLHPYVYFRQLYPDESYHKNRPRYQSWRLTTKPGTLFMCPAGPKTRKELDAYPSFLKWLNGPRTGPPPSSLAYIHADFSIKAMRGDYEMRVKRYLNAFPHVAGIAWDMGWDVHTSPSLTNPDTGTYQGIQRVQADIYRWLRKAHPKMKILMNMNMGSPACEWVDAVMWEGVPIGGITKAGADWQKPFRIPQIAYYYLYASQPEGKDWRPKLVREIMKNLSLGVAWGGGNTPQWLDEPCFTKMTDVARISGRTTAIPEIIQTGAVRIYTADATASVWAAPKKLVAVVFNGGKAAHTVRLRVSGSALARHGFAGHPSVKLTIFGTDGLVRSPEQANARWDHGDLLITADLAPGEMAAAER